MREITYSNFNDYLTKASAYDDPKTIKIYTDNVCLTYLRTHLIQYKGELSKDMFEQLRREGHCRAIMEDIAPLGRM